MSGLWGKPTIVNNVETLCNVPHIINKGAAWFQGLSRTKDGGTKLYGVSGKVKRPGPMGTADGHHDARNSRRTCRRNARRAASFAALLPGGASTDFLVEEHLDVPMDFAEVQKAGSRMGTGTMIVLDDQTCPVGMVWNLEHFFAQESCGWCTPCWSGLGWAEQILEGDGGGPRQNRAISRSWSSRPSSGLPGNTFCALAPGAAEPLQSALKYFREDFERHIR